MKHNKPAAGSNIVVICQIHIKNQFTLHWGKIRHTPVLSCSAQNDKFKVNKILNKNM